MFSIRALLRVAKLVTATFVIAAVAHVGIGQEGGQASAPPDVQSIPINETFVATCTGETVDISGTLEVREHVHTDAAGGVHGVVQATFRQITGLSGSGTRYRLVGGATGVINTNGPSAQAVSHQVDVFNLISQGSAPNLVFVAVFHITFDANNNITADFTNLNIECRGK
jgi:hypothetical protein